MRVPSPLSAESWGCAAPPSAQGTWDGSCDDGALLTGLGASDHLSRFLITPEPQVPGVPLPGLAWLGSTLEPTGWALC